MLASVALAIILAVAGRDYREADQSITRIPEDANNTYSRHPIELLHAPLGEAPKALDAVGRPQPRQHQPKGCPLVNHQFKCDTTAYDGLQHGFTTVTRFRCRP